MRLVQESLRIIVPLSFLSIWALTWMVTRKQQPLPPRPFCGPGRQGDGKASLTFSSRWLWDRDLDRGPSVMKRIG
jgi:hypothetical protein